HVHSDRRRSTERSSSRDAERISGRMSTRARFSFVSSAGLLALLATGACGEDKTRSNGHDHGSHDHDAHVHPGQDFDASVPPDGSVVGDFAWDLPPGFPLLPVPEDNPMSTAKVELGRHLFYDVRLSKNGT